MPSPNIGDAAPEQQQSLLLLSALSSPSFRSGNNPAAGGMTGRGTDKGKSAKGKGERDAADADTVDDTAPDSPYTESFDDGTATAYTYETTTSAYDDWRSTSSGPAGLGLGASTSYDTFGDDSLMTTDTGRFAARDVEMAVREATRLAADALRASREAQEAMRNLKAAKRSRGGKKKGKRVGHPPLLGKGQSKTRGAPHKSKRVDTFSAMTAKNLKELPPELPGGVLMGASKRSAIANDDDASDFVSEAHVVALSDLVKAGAQLSEAVAVSAAATASMATDKETVVAEADEGNDLDDEAGSDVSGDSSSTVVEPYMKILGMLGGGPGDALRSPPTEDETEVSANLNRRSKMQLTNIVNAANAYVRDEEQKAEKADEEKIVDKVEVEDEVDAKTRETEVEPAKHVPEVKDNSFYDTLSAAEIKIRTLWAPDVSNEIEQVDSGASGITKEGDEALHQLTPEQEPQESGASAGITREGNAAPNHLTPDQEPQETSASAGITKEGDAAPNQATPEQGPQQSGVIGIAKEGNAARNQLTLDREPQETIAPTSAAMEAPAIVSISASIGAPAIVSISASIEAPAIVSIGSSMEAPTADTIDAAPQTEATAPPPPTFRVQSDGSIKHIDELWWDRMTIADEAALSTPTGPQAPDLLPAAANDEAEAAHLINSERGDDDTQQKPDEGLLDIEGARRVVEWKGRRPPSPHPKKLAADTSSTSFVTFSTKTPGRAPTPPMAPDLEEDDEDYDPAASSPQEAPRSSSPQEAPRSVDRKLDWLLEMVQAREEQADRLIRAVTERRAELALQDLEEAETEEGTETTTERAVDAFVSEANGASRGVVPGGESFDNDAEKVAYLIEEARGDLVRTLSSLKSAVTPSSSAKSKQASPASSSTSDKYAVTSRSPTPLPPPASLEHRTISKLEGEGTINRAKRDHAAFFAAAHAAAAMNEEEYCPTYDDDDVAPPVTADTDFAKTQGDNAPEAEAPPTKPAKARSRFSFLQCGSTTDVAV